MLNKSGTGVLVFAFNSGDLDYLKLALHCAQRVKKHWGLPVTLVTDKPFESEDAGYVLAESPSDSSVRIYRDYDKTFKFLNRNRYSAWDLTPYEKTIVIDSDFLVSTRQVLDAWGFRGLQLSKTAYSMDGQDLSHDMLELTPDGLPMYWATIICFDRSLVSETFFRYWKKVVANYPAYANLYGYNPALIRNDFCVTIALDFLSCMTGSLDQFTLDYSIPTASQDLFIRSIEKNAFDFKGTQVAFTDSDVHVLNKKDLLSLISESKQ